MNKLIKFFCFYFEYNFPDIKTNLSETYLRQTGHFNNYFIKNKFYFFLYYNINSEKLEYREYV